jgi:hypothetical protein
MEERAYIEQRLQAGLAELGRKTTASERLSWARLGYLVAAVAILAWLRVESWAVMLAALAPFLVLIRLHRQAAGRADVARGAVAAARGSLARMDRDWANVPPLQVVALAGLPNRAVVRDLDVYGDRSLFRLLDVAQPSIGGVALMRWLLEDPAPIGAINDRQASVRVLRDRPEFLLESARLCRHGSRPAVSSNRLAAFRRWCEQPARPFPPALVWLARALTASFIGVVMVMITVPEARDALASIAVMLVGAQFAVGAMGRRHLRATLSDAADMLPELIDLRDVLRAIGAEPPVDGRFGAIQRDLASGGVNPAFDSLARLFGWNTVHHSPMQNVMMNAGLAFDAHLSSRIDRWRAEFGARVPAWIDLAGEAQALTALATLAYENPGWTLPAVHSTASPSIAASGCGHPLLAATVRVTNPVTLEAPGSAVVISGSNMSGKTTYLRAIGLNALLALAGGPVCATAMSIRRCRVRTSVRIEDDLSASVSLFLAEVSRIRDVVVDAEKAGEAPVLFLFDEILHGTNAPDRREASRLVLSRLLASGASGVITTHDAGIGEIAAAGNVAHVHFTDVVKPETGGVTMTFDYVMRPGAATTTNALRLLEAMGLRG